MSGAHREILALQVDGDVWQALDDVAASKGISRHEAARILLRLGVEVMRRQERAAQLELRPTGAR